MIIKSLSIGRLTTKNNIFIAPLAGFSDFAFRSICYDLGAGLCFTEMVSAKGLIFDNENTKDLLYTANNEYIKAAQIFGSEPKVIEKAVLSPALKPFDIIDINFGCPVPKVFNNFEGSKLLQSPSLIGEIVAAAKSSQKQVTCKMRLGINRGQLLATAAAKKAEENGAKMITVHGRYREDYYSGEIDYDGIKAVRQSVNIPVIANGNVFSVKDADHIIERTGCDGVMLARGAINSPWLISELLSTPIPDKKTLIKRHIDLLLQKYPDEKVARYMRKQMAMYFTGLRDAKKLRVLCFKAETTKELKAIVDMADF